LKIIILILIFINLSANVILKKDIITDKHILQIASSKSYTQVEKYIIPYIKNESYFIDFYGNYYVAYIVNVDAKNIKALQNKYNYIFKDTIIRKKFTPTKENNITEKLENIKKSTIVNKTKLIAIPKVKTNKPKTTLTKKRIVKSKIVPKVINDYKSALLDYKNKKYKSCYNKFTKLFQKNIKNTNINFYLGRCSYKVKKYHDAIIAYERVLFENPNSSRTKLEMAKAYFAKNSFKASKKLFEEVKKDKNIPPHTMETTNLFLSMIEKKIKRHFISGVAIVGAVYDSNVNSSSFHDNYNDVEINGIKLDLNNTSKKEDAVAHQEVLVLNHKYLINDSIENRNDLLVFSKMFFEDKHKSKNIQLINFSPSLNVKYNNKLNVSYKLFVDNLFIDKKNNMYSYGINPNIIYPYNNKIKINTVVKYQNKYYKAKQDIDKNSVYIDASIGVLYDYTNKLKFNSSFFYSKEDTKQQNDSKKFKYSFSTTYSSDLRIQITPNISYENTKYKDIDKEYLVKENNKEYKFGIDLKYIYNNNFIIQTMAENIKQTSNKKPNEYTKHTFGLNLIRIF
jgi:hypothetical protein